MFINREAELRALQRLWESGKPEFFILYGRRRVGKTELLKHFSKDKNAIYFLATQVREMDNLRQFREAIRFTVNDPLLENLDFDNWETALTYLSQQSRSQRLAVIIDEFQYLCEGNRALPSILQRFWDTHGRESNLLLIICGSHVSFMEKSVLAEKSPLFGRRTGQQRLLPLSPFDAAQFLPHYSPEERLIVYGILGGMPAYLARFSSDQSIRENITREFLQVQGYLHDEVNFLLRTELGNTSTYASILKAISGGCNKLNEIAQRVGLDAPAANKYLHVLRELNLVRREISFIERAPEKSRKGIYYIEDNYVNFWFRFILPHLSLIEIEQGQMVYDRFILPNIPTYMGPGFESICRDYVRLRWGETHGQYTRRVGRHWDKDFDIDIIAEFVDGGYLIAECKWWQSPVGINVLKELANRCERLPVTLQKNAIPAIFSLRGFTQELEAVAREGKVILVDADMMFA